MPTPETKYNKPSALQLDLSANSYKFNNLFICEKGCSLVRKTTSADVCGACD